MEKKGIFKNFLKFFVGNIMVTLLMYLLYWFAEDYVFPTTYVPAPMIVWKEAFRLFVVEAFIIGIVGFIIGFFFKFIINKKVWIAYSLISFCIGIICGVLYEIDSPLVFLFLPFGGSYMICQYTVLEMEPLWISLFLSAILFSGLQIFFLLSAKFGACVHNTGDGSLSHNENP